MQLKTYKEMLKGREAHEAKKQQQHTTKMYTRDQNYIYINLIMFNLCIL